MRPPERTLPKATDKNDMHSREFPSGNFLFFVVCMMSLLRLPCGKLADDGVHGLPAGNLQRQFCTRFVLGILRSLHETNFVEDAL